jgi:Uma2 family endonuclease
VLSPSTEGFDRGKKFRHYRQIETLKEYVLVDTEKMNIECYRLNEQNKWELTSYSLEELAINQTELEIHLTSVNFNSPISLIYEDVVFPDENLEDLVLS